MVLWVCFAIWFSNGTCLLLVNDLWWLCGYADGFGLMFALLDVGCDVRVSFSYGWWLF